MEHDLYFNIPMILGIKEKSIILTFVLFGCYYKYTCATYDWFCGPGSQMIISKLFTVYKVDVKILLT